MRQKGQLLLARLLRLLLAICAFGAFLGIEWATIHRRLGVYADAYWVGLGVVVICAYAWSTRDTLLRGVVRAVLVPVVGSTVGYALLTAALYLAHGHVNRGVALYEWLFVAAIFPYFATDGWILTLGLTAHPIVVWIVHANGPAANDRTR